MNVVKNHQWHPFKDFFISRDNYLADPDAVCEMSKSPDLEYRRSKTFRGRRSSNLLRCADTSIRMFAENFGNRLSYDVFHGIKDFQIDICFHEYDPLDPEDIAYETGWIHTDAEYCTMAGLVYLHPGEMSMNTGTSLFHGHTQQTDEELIIDVNAVQGFNTSGRVTPEYAAAWQANIDMFPETLRAGNLYNRLVAYDATTNHRTNSFSTSDGKPRLSLLFYVTEYSWGDNK
jgi:hypothetical protein